MPENTVQNQPITVPAAGLTALGGFVSQVYLWMTGGLVLTAIISFLVSYSVEFQYWLFTNSWVLPLIFILELVIVIGLSAMVTRMSTLVAAALFLFYSALNGVFFGMIITAYTESSVFLAFAASAGTFLLMSTYGFITRADLTRWGNLALMGLLGLVLGIILNLFIRSDGISWLLTLVGIAIFIILIAYDTQKIKRMAAQAEAEGKMGRYAVLGALTLYLDFINLFIRLLQIFGKRR